MHVRVKHFPSRVSIAYRRYLWWITKHTAVYLTVQFCESRGANAKESSLVSVRSLGATLDPLISFRKRSAPLPPRVFRSVIRGEDATTNLPEIRIYMLKSGSFNRESRLLRKRCLEKFCGLFVTPLKERSLFKDFWLNNTPTSSDRDVRDAENESYHRRYTFILLQCLYREKNIREKYYLKLKAT